MSRALQTLARLRKLEADQARRALGEAVTREAAADDAAAQARAERAREAEVARTCAGAGGTPLGHAYAAWLPASTRTIAAADHAAAGQREARALAAAALVRRRAALEAVETLTDIENALKRRQAERRAQRRLDEVAGQRASAALADRRSDAAASRLPR